MFILFTKAGKGVNILDLRRVSTFPYRAATDSLGNTTPSASYLSKSLLYSAVISVRAVASLASIKLPAATPTD